MFLKQIEDKKSFFNKYSESISGLVTFFILVILPSITIWVSFYYIQKNLQEDSINETLSEMSEITAHMLRKTEPESYYQDAIQRLADSFKWVESIDEVSRIENKDLLEFALFDENGTRLKWPAGENLVKTKFSQDYLKAIKRFSVSPEASPTPEERNAAIGYSGNEMTLSIIAASPNTLINFQGIGLRKMGGWFKVRFTTENKEKTGDLLAWLNMEKLDKYNLADRTIKSMQKLTKPEYTFSYIDLKQPASNKSSRGRKLKKSATLLLSENSLKYNFVYENELFAINDTQDGIRLICSRPCPKPPSLLKNYNNFLLIFIPVIILFLIWKSVFKVNFNFSIKTQAICVFGFSAIIGFIAILISTIAYQYEKNNTTIQKYKNEAIEILEKVDQQYTDSFDDLLFQYRHFMEVLSNSDKKPAEILAPLIKAQEEEVIAYAVYADHTGKIAFQAPVSGTSKNSSSLAARYNKIVNRLAIQSLRTFNSSRNRIENQSEPASIRVITSNAVDGLLFGRSNFIETKLDNEETLAFMDFAIDDKDYANGCLLIIHDPKKLEKSYLIETGRNLSKTKDFELIAFPKTLSNEQSYYPRHSYIFEEPLWKLNDTVNQNQLPGFKKGRVKGKEVIVGAISANNMKNYNLFLAMPINKIGDKVFSLSKVLLTGTAFSLLIMIFISYLLSHSISFPMNILRKNAIAIEKNQSVEDNLINFSKDSNEIENISTGLTNLVLKAREFKDSKNISNFLLPFVSFSNEDYEIDEINTQDSSNVLSYTSVLDNGNIFMFMLQIDDKDSLDAALWLSIASMSMKIFVEQQGYRSPAQCIKSLEEFFRINYKRDIDGSIISMFLDPKNNIITYSGLGQFSLLKINHQTSECEIIDLPNKESYFNQSIKTNDTNYELQKNSELIAFSRKIESNTLEEFKTEFLKNNVANFKNQLNKNINEIINKDKGNINVLFVHHKSDLPSAQIKKLAENNPIALIRSQITKRSTDA